jgi:hypothetical protein
VEKSRLEVHRALDQISEIHQHLSKAEIYRGYRAVPVASSGILALVAAAVQRNLIGSRTDRIFVVYWVIVGVIATFVAGGGIVHNYWVEKSPIARRRTRTVVGQFIPCITAGILATAALGRAGTPLIPFLPGLWTILFSLGTFASRPYLPRIIGWVALLYLIAVGVLLALAPGGGSLSPWAMGLTFGTGQILAGIVLYRDLERNKNGSQT